MPWQDAVPALSHEGRWDKVYNALQPGDFVLIQFGHNDAGDINVGKARAELRGSGDESKVFLMEKTSKYQVIYTFGWYLRKFIMDVQEKGHSHRFKPYSTQQMERGKDRTQHRVFR